MDESRLVIPEDAFLKACTIFGSSDFEANCRRLDIDPGVFTLLKIAFEKFNAQVLFECGSDVTKVLANAERFIGSSSWTEDNVLVREIDERLAYRASGSHLYPSVAFALIDRAASLRKTFDEDRMRSNRFIERLLVCSPYAIVTDRLPGKFVVALSNAGFKNEAGMYAKIYMTTFVEERSIGANDLSPGALISVSNQLGERTVGLVRKTEEYALARLKATEVSPELTTIDRRPHQLLQALLDIDTQKAMEYASLLIATALKESDFFTADEYPGHTLYVLSRISPEIAQTYGHLRVTQAAQNPGLARLLDQEADTTVRALEKIGLSEGAVLYRALTQRGKVEVNSPTSAVGSLEALGMNR